MLVFKVPTIAMSSEISVLKQQVAQLMRQQAQSPSPTPMPSPQPLPFDFDAMADAVAQQIIAAQHSLISPRNESQQEPGMNMSLDASDV